MTEANSLVEDMARAIARATIVAAEPEKAGRLSDAGIASMVENLAVKFYPEARAALAVLTARLPADDRELVERLRQEVRDEQSISSIIFDCRNDVRWQAADRIITLRSSHDLALNPSPVLGSHD